MNHLTDIIFGYIHEYQHGDITAQELKDKVGALDHHGAVDENDWAAVDWAIECGEEEV